MQAMDDLPDWYKASEEMEMFPFQSCHLMFDSNHSVQKFIAKVKETGYCAPAFFFLSLTAEETQDLINLMVKPEDIDSRLKLQQFCDLIVLGEGQTEFNLIDRLNSYHNFISAFRIMATVAALGLPMLYSKVSLVKSDEKLFGELTLDMIKEIPYGDALTEAVIEEIRKQSR